MATVTYGIATIKPEFIIGFSAIRSPFLDSHERDPSLVALADGGFALSYEWQRISSTSDHGILLERYTIDGALRPSSNFIGGSATLLNTAGLGSTSEVDPAITQLSN